MNFFVKKCEHVLGEQDHVPVQRIPGPVQGPPLWTDKMTDRQTDTTENITFATLFAIGKNGVVLVLSVYPGLTCRILGLSNNNYDLFPTNTGFIFVSEAHVFMGDKRGY